MRIDFFLGARLVKSLTIALLAVLTVQQSISSLPVQSANANLAAKKSQLSFAYIPYTSDVHTATVSAEAIQLAQQLKLTDNLIELSKLKEARLVDKNSLSRDELERYRDLKEEVSETIEPRRMNQIWCMQKRTR